MYQNIVYHTIHNDTLSKLFMKITVISKDSPWSIHELKKSSKKHNIPLEVRDFFPNDTSLENLGEVVLWRSSSLGKSSLRIQLMRKIAKNHILINPSLITYPKVAEKFFQQLFIKENLPHINTIPTFQFSSKEDLLASLEEKILSYPFVCKPNLGSKGQNISKINNIQDIMQLPFSLKNLVFQNFIENTGDYRVLILGKEVLGIIKRKSNKRSFLNNVSQGGSAEHITNAVKIKKLSSIALEVSSAFHLLFCGVDIIFDEKQKKYFFLEINTIPQWQGFQSATKIPVAEKCILYAQKIFANTSS